MWHISKISQRALVIELFPSCPFSFFFSSRRRHTRCGRDWSSDVCSSDLAWRAVFTGLDAQRPPTTAATSIETVETTEEARDAAAERATRDTPLPLAGLSPRAVAAA